MACRRLTLALLLALLHLSSSFSSFQNFPVVGLRSEPALPLAEVEEEVGEVEEEVGEASEEVREAREADISSYSDSLDDTFIEEALYLSPEDREEREVVPRLEEWLEEEGVEEEEEVLRPERDGGHHGHHAAHGEAMARPARRRGARRQGGRQVQRQGRRQEQVEVQEEVLGRAEVQEQRGGRQTGATAPAFGVGVLSSPPDAKGDYNFNFANDDGSSRQEAAGRDGVRGSYSFITPEGEEVSIQYVADETGFHASGSHVPQAPPMPPAIRRLLDHLAKVNGPLTDHAHLY